MEEADKRQRVVQEIVQTEQTYVNRLQLLISVSPDCPSAVFAPALAMGVMVGV